MSITRFTSRLVPSLLLALAVPACGGASVTASAGTGGVGVSASASVDAPVVDANVTVGAATTTTTTTVVEGGTCTEEWIHMPVLINFATGGTEMDAQSRMVLDELVRSAQGRPDLRAVRVEGHTDRCGREATNMALSQSRAEVVATELVRLGVPRERIMTVGYGSTQLRANDDCSPSHELSRATNRRVEFSLLVCR
jgi:OOP family OmpA-OmpF porin